MGTTKGLSKYDWSTTFHEKKKQEDEKKPWKDFNPNCRKCKFRNDFRMWSKEGTCNYANVTGHLRGGKAKDCKGFPGERVSKSVKAPFILFGEEY